MAKRAPPYRLFARDGIAWIDVRSIPGFPRMRETLDVTYGDWARRRPTREATEAAATRFRELVAGRVTAATDRVLTSATDEELVAIWLEAIETPRTKKSVQTKESYGRTWHAFFCDDSRRSDGEPRWKDGKTALQRMVEDSGPEDYALHRLTRVLRKTVRKELVAMFEFFRWLKPRGHIALLPPRPVMPKGEPGVRSGPQRALPVHVEPHEARAIIDTLPEWSDGSKRSNHKHRAFRVRDPNDFMWEMTWRPSTIARLSVPENWSHGAKEVVIHDADDKALYGRTVTLTSRALAILERCAPKQGRIFGEHRYDDYLKAAALKVLPREKALQFARYDLRHGRLNNLLELTGNLLGTAFIGGHKQLTTTNAYLRPQRRQGDAVIAAADAALATLQEDPEGGELEGTTGARAPNSDKETLDFQSGRVDSNHRPLDPQRAIRSQAGEDTSDDGDWEPPSRGESRQLAIDPDGIGARSGHASSYFTDAKRALLVSEVLWEAFDLFAIDGAAS